MTKKRPVGLALALVMLLALVPMTAIAEWVWVPNPYNQPGGWYLVDEYFHVYEDESPLFGEIFIVNGYDGPGGDIVIPDGVTDISSGGIFTQNEEGGLHITSITLPESLVRIRQVCDMPNLENVTILNGDAKIYDHPYFSEDGSVVVTHAFFGNSPDFTIYSIPGGSVELYARRNEINFVALVDVPLPEELIGADEWAELELRMALKSDLLLDDMIGNWTMPTNRLLAADAIVRLIEATSREGETIDEIAERLEFDMTDCFADTDSKAATFLKASGISTGVDNINYDPDGTFTRIQMITMLGRMAEYVCGVGMSYFSPGSETFTDIPTDWPGTDAAVGWAVAAGVTNGIGGGLFDSYSNLQNQHTGVFAFRAFEWLYGW